MEFPIAADVYASDVQNPSYDCATSATTIQGGAPPLMELEEAAGEEPPAETPPPPPLPRVEAEETSPLFANDAESKEAVERKRTTAT
ncbi:hypothetical protein SO694_00170047 [Aureococcus anophagefferens]|uniref:Uncharacterized protein n=1 Tax=Aureococcus anophagefferens TaxID=44056 RepID=A0ABR1FZ74_AURAN